MPPESQARIVRKHFGFLNDLARRLRDDPYAVDVRQAAALTSRFPGLQPLFNSLVSASRTVRKVSDRLVEEWNPFSQRILLSDERLPRMSELERNCTLLAAHTQTFVEWSHEAVHILALEPFFCGYRNLGSKADFVSWNLANEALGFWYADMVVTPAIRDFVPGAELVYSRCAVSNVVFHPEQAFHRAGIHELDRILAVYLQSFLGKRGELGSSGNYYSRALARQIKEFYLGARTSLGNWYRILEQFDLFGGYYRRFCGKENLPSLFTTEVLEESAQLKFENYALRLGTEFLPALERVDGRRTSEVALRRHIQTRAYAAWFLSQALAKGWVFCLDGELNQTAATTALEAYLDGLEAALDLLARKAPRRAIVDRIKKWDNAYDRGVRRELRRGRAHIKYRYKLFPFFAPTDGIIGVSDAYSDFSRAEMEDVVRFIMKRFVWECRQPGRDTQGVIDLLHAFLKACKARSRVDLRRCYNRFMIHPDVLPTWSVELSEIQPGRNEFKEIVFEYT